MTEKERVRGFGKERIQGFEDSRGQVVKNRRQETGDSRQRAEGRGQRSEGRGQRAESSTTLSFPQVFSGNPEDNTFEKCHFEERERREILMMTVC